MRVAVSQWRNRVAPLFDASQQLLIGESSGYGFDVEIIGTLNIAELKMENKVQLLKEAKVDLLICGAISKELETLILNEGIEVDSFVAGEIEHVLRAFSVGALRDGQSYSMPGCSQVRHRSRHGRNRGSCKRRNFYKEADYAKRR